jgi:protein-S-isoprenylcysteine O-methyltransferase Ste14
VLIGLLILVGVSGMPAFWPSSSIGWVALTIGLIAIAVGGWLVVRAFADLGPSLTPVPRPRNDGRLIESGIYARLRHPIYAGVMLAGLGWSGLTRSIGAFVVALLLAAFLDAKARREESWLMERYPAYEAYRKRSKRFVPGIY